MKATVLEFRFRLWIGLVLYVLGFTAPWERSQTAANQHLWSWLAARLFEANYLKPQQAFALIAVLACVLAGLGAWLRVWGTAYLGYSVVQGKAIETNTVVAAGPYRYLRNPLYAGSWLTAAAVSILMPPSGALFLVVALGLFEWRLIGAEEALLTARLGDPYREYRRRVPSLLPYRGGLRGRAEGRPGWGWALPAETYPLGVALCFAGLSWQYDVRLLTRWVVICFGASMVVRALLPARSGSDPQE